MKTHELVRELQSERCRCGNEKKSGQTFCRACYFQLTPQLRTRLYDRVGHGYEEAYAAAVQYLAAENGEATTP